MENIRWNSTRAHAVRFRWEYRASKVDTLMGFAESWERLDVWWAVLVQADTYQLDSAQPVTNLEQLDG